MPAHHLEGYAQKGRKDVKEDELVGNQDKDKEEEEEEEESDEEESSDDEE